LKRRTNSHCVVIGGGVGGLLAAHALADRFEFVTVLERFRYPPDAASPVPQARRGVPQSRCIHVLMAAGAAAFDELIPGWSERLVALGATRFDASADAVLRLPAGTLPRAPSGIISYACSKALLERALRTSLADKASVRLREDQKVLGLVIAPRGGSVTGVSVIDRKTRREKAASEKVLSADLVVDASGEGSALPRWLAVLPNGLRSAPEKTVVASGVQYVSRWFHIESKAAPDWHCLAIAPTTDAGFRSAMMVRAEHDRWGVVLLTPAGEPLPADDNAFLDFVAGLGGGEMRAALAHARPVSPILRYGSTANRLTHYERLSAWPAGLVAIGDSVCTLDPYFGLGMTAAARGVVLLRTHLDQHNGRVSAAEFQNELACFNAEPWQHATGRAPDGRRLARDGAHLDRIYQAAPSNPEIARALLAVQHLLRPAETLSTIPKGGYRFSEKIMLKQRS
jgi:2-polyprenyl-6-methoxyphenol hydroxylase-like FAD-dependent oxidoreductase